LFNFLNVKPKELAHKRNFNNEVNRFLHKNRQSQSNISDDNDNKHQR